MEFYTALGEYYDQVFPLGEAQLSFLTKYIDKPGPVADLACGTGTYAKALGERGYQVIALDLDGEMVRQAREKTQGLPVTVFQGDMRQARQLLQGPAPYAGIFCIGNSIVHLNSLQEIAALCQDVYQLLKPGGAFIIQTVNYDWVLKDGVTGLPTIEREDVTLVRKYNYRRPGDRIEFRGELTYVKDGQPETVMNSVMLLPLLAKDLDKMLKEAGFARVSFFGNFLEAPHSDRTQATVVLACK